jgi:hypothetical protein
VESEKINIEEDVTIIKGKKRVIKTTVKQVTLKVK